MRQTWEMKWLAFTIEWHWWFIMRGRKMGNKLIEAGEPFSSPRLLALSNRVSQHCARVMASEKRYEDFAGITELRDTYQAKSFVAF